MFKYNENHNVSQQILDIQHVKYNKNHNVSSFLMKFELTIIY